MKSDLYLRIEMFYIRLQAGEFDHPYDLAKALEALSNHAWDDVHGIYQSALLP